MIPQSVQFAMEFVFVFRGKIKLILTVLVSNIFSNKGMSSITVIQV
jgi:hypothetical protein